MKSSKLVIVRDLDLQAKIKDKPPTLRPLHKHAVKVISVIEDFKTMHTTGQGLLDRIGRTGLSPAMSGDMLRYLGDVMPPISGPPGGYQPSRCAIHRQQSSSRQSDLENAGSSPRRLRTDVSATYQDDFRPKRAVNAIRERELDGMITGCTPGTERRSRLHPYQAYIPPQRRY